MNRDELPGQSYLRALAALGGARAEKQLADRKMFTIVAHQAESDTYITPDGLFVQWPRWRKPFQYFCYLGPGIVSALRSNAPGHRVDVPFTLDTATLGRLAFSVRGPLWFWVVTQPRSLLIACRPALDPAGPPSSPPPLATWSPAERVFARFHSPRPCPHCHALPERCRIVEDALVCPACARSGPMHPDDLAEASLEADAIADVRAKPR